MKQINKKDILLAYCDKAGSVYEYPAEPAFRTGRKLIKIPSEVLIPLPEGSILFSLPERYPVCYDKNSEISVLSKIDKQEAWAASAFLSSGYLRTYLPAFKKKKDAPILPLWAYSAVVIIDGEFHVPAIRIDDDPRSDPAIHRNNAELKQAIKELLKEYPQNRLVKQLSKCSVDYNCLCARNFFLGRYEAPVPTSPQCNSNCIGCLSFQGESGFCSSQERLSFKPSPEEIAEIIIHHFSRVESAVASFGQGCEGEPLLRGVDIAKAIKIVRSKTSKGTINLNTNGSLPDMTAMLAGSGLDSIRISLNSPTKQYYDRYFRQKAYSFDEVMRSVDNALKADIFVSINLFFLPGFTDMESEVNSLTGFLKQYPVNMIQTRNLNIDPDYYLDCIGFEETPPIGITELLKLLKKSFNIKLGYYNPPKENF